MIRPRAKGSADGTFYISYQLVIVLLAGLFLNLVTWLWSNKVNSTVPSAYLDEVFHIRQAQIYCSGDLRTWDSKITTPPGLYLINWFLHKVGFPCDASHLRATNALVLCSELFSKALMSRLMLRNHVPKVGTRKQDDTENQSFAQDVHTALNVTLFPPLFFFSALYYTDLVSTALVLRYYSHFLSRKNFRTSGFSETSSLSLFVVAVLFQYSAAFTFTMIAACTTFMLVKFCFVTISWSPTRFISHIQSFTLVFDATLSLWFRQTNIFWVAVFPTALALVDQMSAVDMTSLSRLQIIRRSYSGNQVSDPSVDDASFDDYITTVISIMSSTASKSVAILSFRASSRQRQDLVHGFARYGSVILGFSAFVLWNGGVVLGDKSNHIATIHLPQMLYIWPYVAFFSFPLMYQPIMRCLPWKPRTFRLGSSNKTKNPVSHYIIIMFFAAMFAIVIHYNTIVHPFTLADNRHYVFYVFRLLLRHESIKYLAAPIYLLCAYVTLQTLGRPTSDSGRNDKERPNSTTSLKAQQIGNHEAPVHLNFVLIWITTCTLCLISAPLVEPRYFILPWIVWRLHVPCPTPSRFSVTTWSSILRLTIAHGDHRLWLETLWFLIINVLTGYMFLYRGFLWPQEPANVQRFMW